MVNVNDWKTRRVGFLYHQERNSFDSLRLPNVSKAKRLRWSHWRTRTKRQSLCPLLPSLVQAVLSIGFCAYFFWIRHFQFFSIPTELSITSSPSPPELINAKSFPRIVVLTSYDDTGTYHKIQHGEWNDLTDHHAKRKVEYLGDRVAQRGIYRDDTVTVDRVETEDCKLRFMWQKRSFSTCNLIHQVDLTTPWISSRNRQTRHDHHRVIGKGFWRDVWILQQEQQKPTVFKTMRYAHNFTQRNYDRMRRDAAAMERLTVSPFVIDIFAFCGTSSISEYGDGGDIPAALWPSDTKQKRLTQIEKLRIATQAAISLATIHNIDREGQSSIAHTDIAPTQFIKVGDLYKMNDFNRARFLAWSTQNNHTCPYQVGSNPGKNRSPEEYNYEEQTEMVDVYSMGNILFMLLQEEWPFAGLSIIEAQELVKQGRRPDIYYDLWNSSEPVNRALKQGMIWSHQQDPKRRCSARQLEEYLKEQMRQLDPGQLEKWGFKI